MVSQGVLVCSGLPRVTITLVTFAKVSEFIKLKGVYTPLSHDYVCRCLGRGPIGLGRPRKTRKEGMVCRE